MVVMSLPILKVGFSVSYWGMCTLLNTAFHSDPSLDRYSFLFALVTLRIALEMREFTFFTDDTIVFLNSLDIDDLRGRLCKVHSSFQDYFSNN